MAAATSWPAQRTVQQMERCLQPGLGRRRMQPMQIAQRQAGRRASGWTNVVTPVCRMWNLRKDASGIFDRGTLVVCGHTNFKVLGPQDFAVGNNLEPVRLEGIVVFVGLFRLHTPDDTIGDTLHQCHDLRRDQRCARWYDSVKALNEGTPASV